MRTAHAIPPCLPLVFAIMLSPPPSASAVPSDEQPLRFKPEFEPSLPGTPAPMPRIWVEIVPETILDDIVMEQLSAAVSETLMQHEDWRFFEIEVEEGHWRLVAKTAPRDELADVYTEPHLDLFVDCIRSLEPDVDLSNLLAILYGSTPGEGWLDTSRILVEEMLANLGRDGCSKAKSAIRLDMDRLRTITRSMLSDRFSLDDYTEGEIVILTDLLNPLFFGRYGFWSRSRVTASTEILVDAFSNHLLTSSQFRAASETTYRTFFDFVVDMVRGKKPKLVSEFVIGVARLCLPQDGEGDEHLYEPFSLGSCVQEERARPFLFRVAQTDYVLIGEVRP